MSSRKERMTVTVDRALVEAANEAVASGRASSISTWVNTALTERAAKDRYLRAMADAVAEYEAEFGEISEAELVAQQHRLRRTSVADRPARKRAPRSRRGRAA
jgi:Arc/MetJ-type ribon-helix-helix transcriptional regulator